MEDYKELISLCDYWIGLSDENDKKTMTDQLLNRCKCAIEHLVEECKILEWQNHLERCEHQHTKDECDDCATKTYACIVKLEEKLAKVTKERDAMLADLKEYASCDYCKHSNSECDEYWAIGEMGLSGLCNGEHFEWRGVQE